MPTLVVALAAAWTLFGPGVSGESAASPPIAVVPFCQVLLLDDVEVPAQEAGSLLAVHIQEGDVVSKGGLLAQIDDRQAQLQKLTAELERSAARTRADDDVEVQSATASLKLAEAELLEDLEINRKSPGAVPEGEIRRKQLAKHRAELLIQRAKLDLKVAQTTADVQNAAVQAADENIRRRRIVAPFDGVVFELRKNASEWVSAGEPVLRFVRMDRLRVEGFLDGSQFHAAEVAGQPVIVECELARGRKERFEGKVTFVGFLVEAGNKYRVRAEVANRQEKGQPLLRPGMMTTMTIHLPGG